jgi:hypothetical protein
MVQFMEGVLPGGSKAHPGPRRGPVFAPWRRTPGSKKQRAIVQLQNNAWRAFSRLTGFYRTKTEWGNWRWFKIIGRERIAAWP